LDNTESMGARLMRMWLWLLAKLLLLAGLGLIWLIAAWLWFKQESLLFKPTPLPANTSLSTGPDVSETAVAVEGARLSALHLKREGAKGVVFFLHGNAGNLQTWFVNSDLYRRANFDLYMIDYRGYGKSTGEITSEDQLHADVRAAYAQLAPQYAGRKIVIYGRSLGSGLAASLSAELARDPKMQQPDLTVLVSPYSSMVALTADVYPFVPQVLIRYPLHTDKVVASIKSPLLLIHGAADTLIAPSHSVALKSIAPRAEVLLVPGAGHNDLHSFTAYREKFFGALSAL
jgi:uncharacterized protein